MNENAPFAEGDIVEWKMFENDTPRKGFLKRFLGSYSMVMIDAETGQMFDLTTVITSGHKVQVRVTPSRPEMSPNPTADSKA